MTSLPTFLGMPSELRLIIYDMYLAEHRRVRDRRQPTNEHIRFLHVCRQISLEAGHTFRKYISLLHERQIHAFILHSSVSHVEWADVANDGRLLQTLGRREGATPMSHLHLAFRKMPYLATLRVFECRQGIPISLDKLWNKTFSLLFERAMFPSGNSRKLSSYELFLAPGTRVTLFEMIAPEAVRNLRLSGDFNLLTTPSTPSLNHVTMCGASGNFFDRHLIDEWFRGAHLESFIYAQDHRLGFEIRDRHLMSLALGPGTHIQKLVLLGCTRLTSSAVAACVQNMQRLRYFALSLIIADDLLTNFVSDLPLSIAVFKLRVAYVQHAMSKLSGERELSVALETALLCRSPPPEQVCICLRNQVMIEDGKQERWMAIARKAHYVLHIGPWEEGENM